MFSTDDVLLQNGITPTEETREAFSRFFDLVTERNKVVNLTSITTREDFFAKHYADSLSALSEIPVGARVLDIGCGAGFPSIPLKIVRDDLSFVLLDSVGKKIDFVNFAVAELGLVNVVALHERAEDYVGRVGRAAFDVALARAVAPLPTLLEYAMPALAVGGIFIAYKTDVAELATAMSAADKLSAKLVKTKGYTLENGDKRTLFVFAKTAKTDAKYPRGGNKPRLYPL